VTAVLRVENLNGGYAKAPILREVSLEVQPSEIVALFGANGAGKTTLLRAISGALPVCRGEILLGDRRIDRLPTWTRAKLGLAHVPEGRQIFSAMTVRENLEAGALASKAHASIEEVFSLFPWLRDRERQRAGTLSGGEQQMLAISRALVSSPRVMLVDEMSAGLAPVITEQLVERLALVRDRGVGVLLVEQAPHIVADVVDRAYLVEQGRIVARGTMAELGGPAAIAELYLGVATTS
jgi:branched-chain amino acid transport system ATP-binding protein/branched-chain amino acid transport system permease protein